MTTNCSAVSNSHNNIKEVSIAKLNGFIRMIVGLLVWSFKVSLDFTKKRF